MKFAYLVLRLSISNFYHGYMIHITEGVNAVINYFTTSWFVNVSLT